MKTNEHLNVIATVIAQDDAKWQKLRHDTIIAKTALLDAIFAEFVGKKKVNAVRVRSKANDETGVLKAGEFGNNAVTYFGFAFYPDKDGGRKYSPRSSFAMHTNEKRWCDSYKRDKLWFDLCVQEGYLLDADMMPTVLEENFEILEVGE